MKKNDFWFISLICLFIIGVCIDWNIWISAAVVANSLLVLSQVIYKLVKTRYHHG